MTHELPKLKYGYGDLEPYIDARTMEIHYGKHHAAYMNKLNEALGGYSNLQDKPVEELLKNLDAIPDAIRLAVRNFGGGHWNHTFFWSVMGKVGRGEPNGALLEAIRKDFGGFPQFREQFTKIANSGFGSGYAWLAGDSSVRSGQVDALKVMWFPNQDSPISVGLKPILTLDAWEHAYYLKCQNRRPEYVDAWWNVVNWEQVGKNL